MPSPNINYWRAAQVGLEDDAGHYESDTLEDALEELGWAASADGAWEDLRVPLTSAKVGATKAPGFEQWRDDGDSSTGVYAYHFDASSEEQVFFDAQMPHAWLQGSEIRPHLHYVLPSAPTAGQTLKFGLEYTWSNVNGLAPTTELLTATETFTGDEDALTQYIASFTPKISEPTMLVSAMISCRLFRDVTDSYAADAVVLEIDFHYQVDALGSAAEYVK